jgi:hypothetical protein
VPEFSTRVWSEHVSWIFPPTDRYQVLAELTNPDITFIIDSVWVTYDGRPPIVADRSGNFTWVGRFSGSYFGDAHGVSAIGNPFYFVATDLPDTLYEAGPAYLFRVIETVPTTLEPDSNDVTGPWVTLQWLPFPAAFPFTYFVSAVFRGDTVPDTTIWTSGSLPDSQLTVQIPESLGDANYEWTLAVIDSFNNSSRSKEARFTVSAGVSQ